MMVKMKGGCYVMTTTATAVSVATAFKLAAKDDANLEEDLLRPELVTFIVVRI